MVFVSNGLFRTVSVIITVAVINPYLLIVIFLGGFYMYYIVDLGIMPMVECQRFD